MLREGPRRRPGQLGQTGELVAASRIPGAGGAFGLPPLASRTGPLARPAGRGVSPHDGIGPPFDAGGPFLCETPADMEDGRGRSPKEPGSPPAKGAPQKGAPPPAGGRPGGTNPLLKPAQGAAPARPPGGTNAALKPITGAPPAARPPGGTNAALKPITGAPAAARPPGGTNPLLKPISGAPAGSRPPGGTNPLLKPITGQTNAGVANPLLQVQPPEGEAFALEEGPDKFSRMHPLPPEVEVPLKGGTPALVRSGNLGWNESAPPDGRAPGLHRPGPPTPAMERLIAGAAQLFAARGFERTTLEGLADATGFPKPRLLTAFKSKEGVFVRVLQTQVEALVTRVRKDMRAEMPVPLLLKTLSERTHAELEQSPLLLQLVLVQCDEFLPGWEDHLDKLRRRLVDVVAQVLKVGVSEGHIRKELPIDPVASLIFEVQVVGQLLNQRPNPNKEKLAAQRRMLALDVIFNGIRARS